MPAQAVGVSKDTLVAEAAEAIVNGTLYQRGHFTKSALQRDDARFKSPHGKYADVLGPALERLKGQQLLRFDRTRDRFQAINPQAPTGRKRRRTPASPPNPSPFRTRPNYREPLDRLKAVKRMLRGDKSFSLANPGVLVALGFEGSPSEAEKFLDGYCQPKGWLEKGERYAYRFLVDPLNLKDSEPKPLPEPKAPVEVPRVIRSTVAPAKAVATPASPSSSDDPVAVLQQIAEDERALSAEREALAKRREAAESKLAARRFEAFQQWTPGLQAKFLSLVEGFTPEV